MQKHYQIEPAQIEWRDDAPYSLSYQDLYFDGGDGVAESRHVFIDGNDLPRRLAEQPRFVIGETGFGTGLNFLQTWALWREVRRAGSTLHFVSFEGHPLTLADLRRAQGAWPHFAALAEALQSRYPPLLSGAHTLHFDDGAVRLTLVYGDINRTLSNMQLAADAWFLDGFNPATNPAMWQPQLLQQLAARTRPAGTIATYSAAGQVRRSLEAAGFCVSKRPGFGRKREMVTAALAQPTTPASRTPWFATPAPSDGHSAVVIGAGLAGCAVANTLARRGWQVTLCDAHDELADGASGNPAGVFMPALTADASTYARFYLSAYLQTAAQLDQLDESVVAGHGVLQLALDDAIRERQSAIVAALGKRCDIARLVDTAQASELAGTRLSGGGLYYPQAGWLQPRALCRFWSAHPNIAIRTRFAVTELTRAGPKWQAHSTRGDNLSADIAVLAAGPHSTRFAQTAWLRLTPARGQIATLRAGVEAPSLRCAVFHEGYLLPAINQQFTAGATFVPGDAGADLRTPEREQILRNLARHLPEMYAALHQTVSGDRAAVRATTADQMPLVGGVIDAAAFRTTYADLQHGRRPDRYPSAPLLPGLFISSGHGARALVSAWPAAELLAAMINAEPLPLGNDLVDALNPARFLVRELKRGGGA